MTDLYIGLKQQTQLRTATTPAYQPDAQHEVDPAIESWDPETNTLNGPGVGYETIFQVGDLVFNSLWYMPHAFVTETARDYVVFDGPIGGMNENGFCLMTFDGGDITDPANFTPRPANFVAYRDGNHESAYLLKFDSTNLNPSRFTAKGGAPDYVQWWYLDYNPGLPLPDFRVVEVVSDDTLKLDKPIQIPVGFFVFVGQDGVIQRNPLKDVRFINMFYGINYGTFDILCQSLENQSSAFWEPWDSYVVSPYNYNTDQMKIRIDDICNRIDGLISGNYSDNWVAIFDEPGAFLG